MSVKNFLVLLAVVGGRSGRDGIILIEPCGICSTVKAYSSFDHLTALISRQSEVFGT